jgi:hypothetical protein
MYTLFLIVVLSGVPTAYVVPEKLSCHQVAGLINISIIKNDIDGFAYCSPLWET